MAVSDRGFASMKKDKQRKIASAGGRAAHAKGTAHQWTALEARDAGRKGGIEAARRKRVEREQEEAANGNSTDV